MTYSFADIKKLFVPFETAKKDFVYYERILATKGKNIEGDMLEVGAGFGRQTQELFSYSITSLDCVEVDPICIPTLVSLVSKKGNVSIYEDNICSYSSAHEYNLIFLTSHIMPFIHPDDTKKVFKSLFGLTKLGGSILFDLRNSLWYMKNFTTTKQIKFDSDGNERTRTGAFTHIQSEQYLFSITYTLRGVIHFEEVIPCYLHDIVRINDECIGAGFSLESYAYQSLNSYTDEDRFILFHGQKN